MPHNTLSGLKSIPYFSDIPDEILSKLAACAVRKTFPKGAIIINEGDEAGPLFVVLSGRVRTFLNDENGKEVTLSMQGQPSYFGELSLLDGQPRSASVMTMEATVCALVPRQAFLGWLHAHPDEAGMGLMRGLTKRIRLLTENVRGLMLFDVYGRLVRTLMELAVEENGEWVVKERFKHQELGSIVGASREMISKIMKELSDDGYVTVEPKSIRIHRKPPTPW
ncbi:Crp/Fnr family transcriptional regulator [Methylococcus sp. EFPC2]|uniref:Crp/Fnr family transcriptional regulator n=1 Tax=Methylococcus sp. EFPC2 TaxID=2812648 RepID=UPI001967288A|nr:Crp/Fnr family transcriptional regulator [Methylococcus sp. EFPC2]QSA96224.1 Crp/Fnr family transcriptional regulator [Methylococcus sp. EFPC2]